MPSQNARLKRIAGYAAIALAAGLAVCGCMDEEMAGSTGTGNTGKGVIAGRVVDASGKGVANAKVRVVPADHNPGPGGAAGDVADVVLTGADGAYRTDSLPDGRYNLLSDKGGLLAFRDSVAVSGSAATELGGDTLKAPGTVSGVVGLRPGHDGRTVFLILTGTTTFVVPKDSAGNFRLGPLAEGEYRLRVLSTLDTYRPMDTVVTVRAGVDAALPDTLRPAYQGPDFGELPLIDVSLAYDTARLAVSLRWAKPGDARVAAYHVYRRQEDSGYARLTGTPLEDTAFREDWTAGITPGTTYHYVVTALDSAGNEGRKGSPAALAMTSRFQAETLVENEPMLRYGLMDIAPDGALWMADAGTREIVRYGSSGEVSRFGDSLAFVYGVWQLVLDSAGDVYTLSAATNSRPMTIHLGKYSPTGVRQWQIQIPMPQNSTMSLYRDGEAVSIWNHYLRTLEVYARDGRVLSRDTVGAAGASAVDYRPGIGFFTQPDPVDGQDSIRIEFLDRTGRVVSNWRPGRSLSLADMERDPEGRWFLKFSESVHVFSPDRELLGILPRYAAGGRLLWRNGALYIQDLDPDRLARLRL